MSDTQVDARPKSKRRPSPPPVPGSNGPLRVVKVVRPNDEYDVGSVYQYRYPRADKQWDRARLNQELTEHGLALAEENGHPKFCELKDCWEPATDGYFCSKDHRTTALTAHDRLMSF